MLQNLRLVCRRIQATSGVQMAGLVTLFVEQMANLIPDLTEFVDELVQTVIDQGLEQLTKQLVEQLAKQLVEQLVEQLAKQLVELLSEQSVV